MILAKLKLWLQSCFPKLYIIGVGYVSFRRSAIGIVNYRSLTYHSGLFIHTLFVKHFEIETGSASLRTSSEQSTIRVLDSYLMPKPRENSFATAVSN